MSQTNTKEYYEARRFAPKHVKGIEQFSAQWFEVCGREFVKAMRAVYPLDEIRNFKTAKLKPIEDIEVKEKRSVSTLKRRQVAEMQRRVEAIRLRQLSVRAEPSHNE